ncbi:MAG: zinc ribbon domain-containing protein [Deltaproteobacteria bacterium]|nr:zinc ribbon domain-containing protein [Deltaproteobacteria bacterium]
MDCENCGAPATPGLVACGYCDDPLPGMGPGVACPNCGDRNVATNASCVSCRTSLVKSCVFCGVASPFTAVYCVRCNESFVGAAERKAEREQAARNQQMIGLAAQGLSVIGSAVSTPAGQGFMSQLLGEVMQDITKPRKKW